MSVGSMMPASDIRQVHSTFFALCSLVYGMRMVMELLPSLQPASPVRPMSSIDTLLSRNARRVMQNKAPPQTKSPASRSHFIILHIAHVGIRAWPERARSSWNVSRADHQASGAFAFGEGAPVGISSGGRGSVGFPFGEGLLLGILFGEEVSAGFPFDEGESAGFPFDEPRQTRFRQNRPHQTHFQQTEPRQTRFQQTGPRETRFQQETPRQTEFQQITGPAL
jgi:hypothetical protein